MRTPDLSNARRVWWVREVMLVMPKGRGSRKNDTVSEAGIWDGTHVWVQEGGGPDNLISFVPSDTERIMPRARVYQTIDDVAINYGLPSNRGWARVEEKDSRIA